MRQLCGEGDSCVGLGGMNGSLNEAGGLGKVRGSAYWALRRRGAVAETGSWVGQKSQVCVGVDDKKQY